MRTDGQTDMAKRIVAFRNFANAPYQFYIFPRQCFLCVLRGSQQTAIICVCGINCSVFVTEAESVYCAVRTESLNINQVNPGF
jgi:hypothetical protein